MFRYQNKDSHLFHLQMSDELIMWIIIDLIMAWFSWASIYASDIKYWRDRSDWLIEQYIKSETKITFS